MNHLSRSGRGAAVGVVAVASVFTLAYAATSATSTPRIAVRQAQQANKNLLDVKPVMTPSSAQVRVTPSSTGFTVTMAPGADAYPGVALKPAMPWDLSAFGHVEARVVNTGTKPLVLSLRLDNAGDWRDNPWNTETVTIAPGASATLTTIFGYAYGKKPGYHLDPKAVVNILLFAGKSDVEQSFKVESLVSAGPKGEKPPVPPDAVRIRPDADGSLLNGSLTTVTGENGAATQTEPQENKKENKADIRADFPEGSGANAAVNLRPTTGRWDLRQYLEVRVAVRNVGASPVAPKVRLESNGGPREVVGASIAPGATATIVVPFVAPTVPDLSKPETVQRFTSDAVGRLVLTAGEAGKKRTLVVEEVRAVMPPAPKLPEWLGKRPPVPGDWAKTLDDEFDGPTLNTKIWDPEGENYYDKTTHWSKQNVVMGGGLARLRYEKKTGFHNDDSSKKKSDYASGYLNTYGKWTQRYGYFETRVKMPSAPGLWPAFWMMPERGVAAGPEQWKRQDTANGGMEFDILESLTRWGPTRYNIAMHYDGYEKNHKSVGSDFIYAQPDADGFLTVGLLWTPGSAVYYANGREVLRWENPRISNVPSALMFTLPMGGWDNDSLDDSRLPADFVIDYVRVWQRKDLSTAP